MSKITQVRRYANMVEAEVACSALNAAGIKAFIAERNNALAVGPIMVLGARLMVHEDDLQAAEEFLASAERGELSFDTGETDE